MSTKQAGRCALFLFYRLVSTCILYIYLLTWISCWSDASVRMTTKVTTNWAKPRRSRYSDGQIDIFDSETQSIPTMVRDWLTMTFTRSLTNIRLRQDRLRFRSVANAIRAGIVVDRSPSPSFTTYYYHSTKAE